MLSLAAPVFLFTLFGLALPIAVHFINRGAGPKIKVGSVRFLEEGEQLRFRGLKLEEPWLLSLRIWLLAVLALLLARPFWHGATQVEKPGWVLASRTLLQAPQQFPDARRELTELEDRGFEVRLLAPGLPSPDSAFFDYEGANKNNLWSILAEADARLETGRGLVVFSETRLESFLGIRPRLSREITWRTLPDLGANRWIEKAYPTGGDMLRVTAGNSNAGGNRFEDIRLRRPSQVGEIVQEVNITASLSKGGEPLVSLKSGDHFPQDNSLSLDLGPRAITIYYEAASRAEDVAYLDAALGAVAQRTGLPVQVEKREVSATATQTERPMLAFWLSEQQIPNELFDWAILGTLLFTDSGGATFDTTETRFQLAAASGPTSVMLYRRTPAVEQGVPVWRDGFGEPVLEREVKGKGALLRFHSRLHPQWSGLVLDPAFPEWLLDLISESCFQESSVFPVADMRVLSESQAVPAVRSETRDMDRIQRRTPLHTALWLLGLAGFLVERCWSEARAA